MHNQMVTMKCIPKIANICQLLIIESILEEFSNCSDAVKEAKKSYLKSNGCKTCSNACHTSYFIKLCA